VTGSSAVPAALTSSQAVAPIAAVRFMTDRLLIGAGAGD
jgi:hypothetical protein